MLKYQDNVEKYVKTTGGGNLAALSFVFDKNLYYERNEKNENKENFGRASFRGNGGYVRGISRIRG